MIESAMKIGIIISASAVIFCCVLFLIDSYERKKLIQKHIMVNTGVLYRLPKRRNKYFNNYLVLRDDNSIIVKLLVSDYCAKYLEKDGYLIERPKR